MGTIRGIKLKNFEFTEFSESAELYADGELLFNLQHFRTLLGVPFYPSKAKGALARFDDKDKKSQHYAMNRYSTAIDGFCDCHIFKAWSIAISCGLWGGVGVYFDTKGNNGSPWPMLHLDLRPNRLFWYRANGHYLYSTNKFFYECLLSNFHDHL
jgi:hypothetical protein